MNWKIVIWGLITIVAFICINTWFEPDQKQFWFVILELVLTVSASATGICLAINRYQPEARLGETVLVLAKYQTTDEAGLTNELAVQLPSGRITHISERRIQNDGFLVDSGSFLVKVVGGFAIQGPEPLPEIASSSLEIRTLGERGRF